MEGEEDNREEEDEGGEKEETRLNRRKSNGNGKEKRLRRKKGLLGLTGPTSPCLFHNSYLASSVSLENISCGTENIKIFSREIFQLLTLSYIIL